MAWEIHVTFSPLSTPSWTQRRDTTCPRMNCFRCPQIPEPEHEVCELSHRSQLVTFVFALTLARSSPVPQKGKPRQDIPSLMQNYPASSDGLGPPLALPNQDSDSRLLLQPGLLQRPDETE